jgi:hypothetical protein
MENEELNNLSEVTKQFQMPSLKDFKKMFDEIIISRSSEKTIEKRNQKINQILDDEPTTI